MMNMMMLEERGTKATNKANIYPEPPALKYTIGHKKIKNLK